MKQFFLLALLLFSFYFLTLSQEVAFNIGIGTSTFTEKTPDNTSLQDPKFSLNTGIGIRHALTKRISLYSGVQINVKRSGFSYNEYKTNYEFEYNSKSSLFSASIPITLNYDIPLGKNRIQLGAGGFLGVNIFATQKYNWKLTLDGETYYNLGSGNLKFKDQAEGDEIYDIRRIDIGLKWSISYNLKRISLRLDSEYGLRNLSQYENSVGQLLTRSLWLSVSIPLNSEMKQE